MRVISRLVVAGSVLAAAGCSAPSGIGRLADPSPSAAAAPAKSPAVLNAACPVLGAAELRGELSDPSAYDAVEAPAQNGTYSKYYRCEYRRAGTTTAVAELTVGIAKIAVPADEIAFAERSCTAAGAVSIPGVGDGAMTCRDSYGNTVVVVVKISHGQTRVAFLGIVEHPADPDPHSFESLAQLMAQRL
ncbi:hypothetical protein [Amycolatopsis sp. NPDC051903]|uniref:hypothetical protein n=1 Tax=Amycolatopsis sp. NPDC051903 TaxID=3363936 RepID=UPI0037B396F7